MNIDEQIANNLASQIAKAIDTEVLMTTIGWHKLEINEGRVYGARYLTVHPSNGWHWNEMMAWMVETFGPSAVDGVWTPSMRWYANNSKFWFRNEPDLTMFLLKWS